jgi:hypothetical protein
MDKPIAWYDPTNGVVSTDKDSPLFTSLGQVWGLYLKEEAKDEPYGYVWFTKQMEHRFTRIEPHPNMGAMNIKPIYTTPPQRTWVGLTKEERHKISMANRPYCADIMAAHEEELKRRNT